MQPRAHAGGAAGAAGPISRPVRSRRARARRAARTDPISLGLAFFGMALCIGILWALLPPQAFRFVKHGYYLLIAALLVQDHARAIPVALRDPWAWAAVLLMGLSSLWAESPAWAFKRAVVTFQTTTLGLFLALRLSLHEQVRVAAWSLAATVFANAVYLFVKPEASYMLYEGERAFMGFMGHKNSMGLILALGMPAFLLQARRGGPDRFVMLAAMAVGAGLLVISRSLTSASVSLVLLAVVVLMPTARRMRRSWILLLPPAVLLAGTLAAMGGLTDQILILLGRDPTFTGRTDIWREVFPVIAQKPILGHSIVSFWQRDIVSEHHVWFSNAHNGFLQMAIELGLVGLAVLVLQMGTTLVRSVRAHGGLPGEGAVWPICMASLFVLFNMSEVVLMRENSIVWALVVGASLRVRKEAVDRAAAARRRRRAARADASPGYASAGPSSGGASGGRGPAPPPATRWHQ